MPVELPRPPFQWYVCTKVISAGLPMENTVAAVGPLETPPPLMLLKIAMSVASAGIDSNTVKMPVDIALKKVMIVLLNMRKHLSHRFALLHERGNETKKHQLPATFSKK